MSALPTPAWRTLLPSLAVGEGPPGAARWQVERPALGGPVEIEVAPADLDAWRAETQALARLQHPAIPALHEVGVLADGRVARVRAVVRGEPGAAWAEARGAHARGDTLVRAAEALAHAHARGVAHGRFGPDVLRLGARGQVWVTGWSARAADAGAVAADLAALRALVDAWLGPAALGDTTGGLTTASGCAAALGRWLDGTDRRARALDAVHHAEALLASGADATTAAAIAERAARRALAEVPTWAPEADKHAAWALADAAEVRRRTGRDHVQAARRALHAALEQDAALPEAHAAMARSFRAEAARAAREGAPAAEARAEHAVGDHVHQLPADHPLRARGDRFLRGTGALTLVTDPPGALVTVERYEEVDHHLVLRPAGTLGRTPLHAVDLAPGSYRLRLDAPGRAPAHYPVHIERNAHWDGVPPGGSAPFPIVLLPDDPRAADDCYVPAGWFVAGSATAAGAGPVRRVWCDAFVMRRFPVTARDLLGWLDALQDAGQAELAAALAPRVNWFVGPGIPQYPRGADGRFSSALPEDQADWPARSVSFPAAVAYAEALRVAEARPWRLPMDLEWEKAARGVDARVAPWGRRRLAPWANRHVAGRAPTLVPVRSFPRDESPYGVRGFAGNVLERVADPYEPGGPDLLDDRVAVLDPTPVQRGIAQGIGRGANYASQDPHLAARDFPLAEEPLPQIGLRLARSVGG